MLRKVTWSGRSKKSKLLVQYLADGGSLDDLKIEQDDEAMNKSITCKL